MSLSRKYKAVIMSLTMGLWCIKNTRSSQFFKSSYKFGLFHFVLSCINIFKLSSINPTTKDGFHIATVRPLSCAERNTLRIYDSKAALNT